MKRTQKLVTWGIVILVVLVVLLMLVSNLRRSSRVVLPDTNTSAEGGGDLPSEGGALTVVEVTPETVQAAIETLHRPEAYSRTVTVEYLWTGGSGTIELSTAVSAPWTRVDRTLPDGQVQPVHGRARPEAARQSMSLNGIHALSSFLFGIAAVMAAKICPACALGGRAMPCSVSASSRSWSPGAIPNISRTSAGMTICPFGPTFTVVMYFPSGKPLFPMVLPPFPICITCITSYTTVEIKSQPVHVFFVHGFDSVRTPDSQCPGTQCSVSHGRRSQRGTAA